MTIYNEITNNLLENGAKEFYRFQGHKSFECYDIRNNRFNNDAYHYVYFSNSKDHHYYFTIKRLKQLINTTILNDTNYQITRRQLDNPDNFKHIKNLIFNSDKIKNLNSISLVCDQTYYALITNNCINNYQKTLNNSIERVDRKVFGGGYGVTGPWLDLLNDLTYFSSHIRISNIDIINLIKQMKIKGIQPNPLLIKNILEKTQRNYIISNNLYNDFHKYNIMNDLENIYQNNLFLNDINPNKTIKKVLTSYHKNRDHILFSLENKYHNHFQNR